MNFTLLKTKTLQSYLLQNQQVSLQHPAYSKLFTISVSSVDKSALHKNEENKVYAALGINLSSGM
jgi:hypothetical protein